MKKVELLILPPPGIQDRDFYFDSSSAGVVSSAREARVLRHIDGFRQYLRERGCEDRCPDPSQQFFRYTSMSQNGYAVVWMEVDDESSKEFYGQAIFLLPHLIDDRRQMLLKQCLHDRPWLLHQDTSISIQRVLEEQEDFLIRVICDAAPPKDAIPSLLTELDNGLMEARKNVRSTRNK